MINMWKIRSMTLVTMWCTVSAMTYHFNDNVSVWISVETINHTQIWIGASNPPEISCANITTEDTIQTHTCIEKTASQYLMIQQPVSTNLGICEVYVLANKYEGKHGIFIIITSASPPPLQLSSPCPIGIIMTVTAIIHHRRLNYHHLHHKPHHRSMTITTTTTTTNYSTTINLLINCNICSLYLSHLVWVFICFYCSINVWLWSTARDTTGIWGVC